MCSVMMSKVQYEETEQSAWVKSNYNLSWREQDRSVSKPKNCFRCYNSEEIFTLSYSFTNSLISAPQPQFVIMIVITITVSFVHKWADGHAVLYVFERLTWWLWRCGADAELVTHWSQGMCLVWWWPTPPRRYCPRLPAHAHIQMQHSQILLNTFRVFVWQNFQIVLGKIGIFWRTCVPGPRQCLWFGSS